MKIFPPYKIELEISSLCNAKCSGCQRTMMDNKNISYYKGNVSLDQIISWFEFVDIKNSRIKLCGVLGDPIINPECVEICNYLIMEKKVRFIEISTNGGTRSSKFWKELAFLSKMTEKVYVHWSIDGVTINDYRENVNLEKVWENFYIYYNHGGKCIWQYIHFDYNSHEIELAKELAKKLNIELKIRVSWRNTSDNAKFKSSEAFKIDNDNYEIVENRARSGDYDFSNIVCRHKMQNEIFITSEGYLWPCCHLHDEQVSRKTDIIKMLNLDNNLNDKKFLDILNSEWYTNILEESWNKNHKYHLPRCYLTCGDNGKRKVIK